MIDVNVEDDYGEKKLSNEIITHSLTFMLAGYETSADTLTYTTYQLALNTDVQLNCKKRLMSISETTQ